jgi:uncharacterized membrane protein YadS
MAVVTSTLRASGQDACGAEAVALGRPVTIARARNTRRANRAVFPAADLPC